MHSCTFGFNVGWSSYGGISPSMLSFLGGRKRRRRRIMLSRGTEDVGSWQWVFSGRSQKSPPVPRNERDGLEFVESLKEAEAAMPFFGDSFGCPKWNRFRKLSQAGFAASHSDIFRSPCDRQGSFSSSPSILLPPPCPFKGRRGGSRLISVCKEEGDVGWCGFKEQAPRGK